MTSMFESTVALWNWPMTTVKLATDMAETMLGAQRVIAARMPALQGAMQNPLTADHIELGRMVSEKVEAFAASGRSVRNAGKTVERATAANSRALSRMASGSILWPADWFKLLEQNLDAVTTMMTLPALALKPVHSGVMSNDRRLQAK